MTRGARHFPSADSAASALRPAWACGWVPIHSACRSPARSPSTGLSEIGSESEKASFHFALRPGKQAGSPSRELHAPSCSAYRLPLVGCAVWACCRLGAPHGLIGVMPLTPAALTPLRVHR